VIRPSFRAESGVLRCDFLCIIESALPRKNVKSRQINDLTA
jgi:hypothetical protein